MDPTPAPTNKKLPILNVLASLCFACGSLLFLPQFAHWSTLGVWLFFTGSVFMLVTSALFLRG